VAILPGKKPLPSSRLRRFATSSWLWHLALLVPLSAWWESVFIHRGLNIRDEGWPLYAAMQMHAGGTLYDDVLWVFPPGHVLPAWIGAWIHAPGIEITRMIYASFSVALVVGMYALGRRLMPPAFALLGSLLLAVAAPRTHLMHAVYGYRYLIFCVLALLAFDRRLRSGDSRWMFAAGLATGLALFFRYDPASALIVALVAGVLTASRSPQIWLRDALWYAAGGLLVGLPTLAWFASTVGVGTFLYEAAIHPLEMLQALPVPDLTLPGEVNRSSFVFFYVLLEFRIFALLYAAWALWLGWHVWRAVQERRPFENPLLLATVLWGGIYFVRSFGRADEPHLDSAIPPVCLLLAYTAHRAYVRWPRRAAETAAVVGGFTLWVYLLGVDTVFDYTYLAEIREEKLDVTWSQKQRIEKIQQWSKPGEQILDLTASPLLHVASQRPGPGYRDVVMPGTFVGGGDEERFIARLEAHPPVLVLWPLKIFDDMPERSLRRTAPRVVKWVLKRYEMRAFDDEIAFLLPIRPGVPPTVEDLTGKGRSMATVRRQPDEGSAEGRR
jgi:hypothetical protein